MQKPIEKFYYPGIALLVVLGIFLIVRFGVTPGPVAVMEPALFDQPEQIGAALAKQLSVEVTSSPVVVVGVMPEFSPHLRVAKGFVEGAWAAGYRYDLLIKEPNLPIAEGYPAAETIELSFSHDLQQIETKVREAQTAGRKVLIYTATFYSSHLLRDNPIKRFEKSFGHPVLAVSTAQFALRREEERELVPGCVGAAQDQVALAPLGCAVLQQGRVNYRRYIEPGSKFAATAIRNGQSDYLILVHGPDAPTLEAPAVETPEVETPAAETPAAQTPSAGSPATEVPAETPNPLDQSKSPDQAQ